MCSRVSEYCLYSSDGALPGDRSSPCKRASCVQITSTCPHFIKLGLTNKGHNPWAREDTADEYFHFSGLSLP